MIFKSLHLRLGSELSQGLCDSLDEVADVTGRAWGTFPEPQIGSGDAYLGDLHYHLLSRISPGGEIGEKG